MNTQAYSYYTTKRHLLLKVLMWITCGCGKSKNRTPEPVDATNFYNSKKDRKK